MGKGVSCIRRRLVVNEGGAVRGRAEHRSRRNARNDPQAPTKGDAYDLRGTVTETGGEAPARSVGNSKIGRRA
ncbi:hypothetical protein SRM_00606 [Salinibacter ruber M8]|jgi:hypothetical protein|uniref:Uncharacterized protein n=1 Tax=Salinibacter ruber (strain M8) TaxID=761659 RepID=D5H672_SALRM|nr:hypothetical protein SRM_00606 [Salinibacter ruber M8]